MKLFGHPLHLMLIHFPSALFPMDLVCACIARYTGSEPLYQASFCALAGGVIAGWAAAITGMSDLGKLVNKKPNSVRRALIHGGINTTVLIVYTLFAVTAYLKYPAPVHDDALKLAMKAVLVISMVFGNYLGGNLVLKDKVLDEE